MKTSRATIDDRPISFQADLTILQAATRLGIEIPTLCHVEGLPAEGGCRMCVVEVKGASRPVAACHHPIMNGMTIRTVTPALHELRRGILQLIVSEHRPDVFRGLGNGTKFARLLAQYEVKESPFRDTAASLSASISPQSSTGHSAAFSQGNVDDSHPYMRFNRSLCIACRACLHACAQVQGQFVFGVEGRGGNSRLIFGPTERFADSPCVACGACVDVCPTAAISDCDRGSPHPGERSVQTTCAYCGVGCQVRVEASHDTVLRMDGVVDAAVNHGHLCVKGRYAHAYHRSGDRLQSPLLRDGESFRPVTWPDAITWLSRRLMELRDRYGPDSLGVLTSARSTNEAAYLLQKLFRTAIGTNNVDCCARVCHASTAVALHRSTGSSAGTASFDDIERAGCIVLAGSNAAAGHPVVGARIKQAALRGVPLIVIDPRRIELAEFARLHLPVLPGTNVPLFNAIAKLLIEQNLIDPEYLRARCEGFDELAAFLGSKTLEELIAPTGVDERSVREAAQLIGGRRPVLFVHGIGLSELTQGTDAVMALINLSMLTGGIGLSGGGMLPLRGQNNVQGNVDMGATPARVTGDQRIDDPTVQRRINEIWGKPLPISRGRMLPDMLDAAVAGEIRGLWIQGFDLTQSAPNESHTLEALKRLDLLVVQDIFFCELCRDAHLILPAAAGLEQDGTFTNAERRIQLVRPAVPPPGLARPEWEIIRDVARAMGENWNYQNAAEVMDEIARVAPNSFGGISHRRLEADGLQWPCPTADHPGTATMHADGFACGRGRLMAIDYVPSPEQTDGEHPYLLITGRKLEHFNVGTMTRRTRNQELVDFDCVEIHPDDANREGILDGGMAELVSRWGKVCARVRFSDGLAPGTVFLTFHQPQTHTNRLTSPYVDPHSHCPEYKRTAVRIRMVQETMRSVLPT